MEAVKDEFPKIDVYTYTVTPFITRPPTSEEGGGRVTDSSGCLHSYNSLLTLVYTQAFTEGGVWKVNGDVMREVFKLERKGKMEGVEIKDINKRIAKEISTVLEPIWGEGKDGGEWIDGDFGGGIGGCVNRGCKWVDFRCVTEEDLKFGRGKNWSKGKGGVEVRRGERLGERGEGRGRMGRETFLDTK